MAEGRIVWIDLETGGLYPAKHQIIQVAAIATSDEYPFREVGWFEAKIELVDGWWEQEALDVNCYDPEVWEKEALASAGVLHELSGFLREHSTVEKISRAKGTPYKVARLGGHNLADFDLGFLKAWFKGHKKFLPATTHCSEVYDTIHGTRWYSLVTGTEFENLKLETIAGHFGIEVEFHDAKGDTRATLEIARRLFAALGGKGIAL